MHSNCKKKSNKMKTDIILAGVGGQGILSIATVIGKAALDNDLNIKQAEVHGMSQRGGDVQSNLRISDKAIASDLIPYGSADLIISMEPMECLRYVPFLKKEGWIITSTVPFINIPNYPSEKDLMNTLSKFENMIAFDMDQVAKEIGSPKSSNMVLLGASSPFIKIDENALIKGISDIFQKKGEKIIDLNIQAFKKGREIALKYLSENRKNY